MTPKPTAPAPSECLDSAGMAQLGAALAVLRARAGLNQAQAGAAVGITHQGWAKYENGRSGAIFKPSVQERLAKALNATRADLLDEVRRRAGEKPADEDWQAKSFLDVGEAP